MGLRYSSRVKETLVVQDPNTATCSAMLLNYKNTDHNHILLHFKTHIVPKAKIWPCLASSQEPERMLLRRDESETPIYLRASSPLRMLWYEYADDENCHSFCLLSKMAQLTTHFQTYSRWTAKIWQYIINILSRARVDFVGPGWFGNADLTAIITSLW